MNSQHPCHRLRDEMERLFGSDYPVGVKKVPGVGHSFFLPWTGFFPGEAGVWQGIPPHESFPLDQVPLPLGKVMILGHNWHCEAEYNRSVGEKFEEYDMDIINPEIPSDMVLEGRRTGPAVFALEHQPSGKRMIYSTAYLSKRLSDHRHDLAARDHPNPDVQADLLRDGADAFRLIVLELVDRPSTLRQRRRAHLERARATGQVYNPPDPPSRQRTVVATEVVVKTRLEKLLETLDRIRLPSADSLAERETRIDATVARLRELLGQG